MQGSAGRRVGERGIGGTVSLRDAESGEQDWRGVLLRAGLPLPLSLLCRPTGAQSSQCCYGERTQEQAARSRRRPWALMVPKAVGV